MKTFIEKGIDKFRYFIFNSKETEDLLQQELKKYTISLLQKQVEEWEEEIKINKHIIDLHSVAPFDWHEGKIEMCKMFIQKNQTLIKSLKENNDTPKQRP